MARTVLVVDDIDFVRKTLTEILTQAHFHVVGEASTGKEAIEAYQRLRPDVVTMDIVMPGISGLEATKTILKMDTDAKVVIVSAMDQESLVMEAINLGARDYILKPFSAEDIRRTLERVLTADEQVTGKSL